MLGQAAFHAPLQTSESMAVSKAVSLPAWAPRPGGCCSCSDIPGCARDAMRGA